VPPVAVTPDGNVAVPIFEVASIAPPSTTDGIGAGAGAGVGAGAGAGVESPPPPPQPAATNTNRAGSHFMAARREVDEVYCFCMRVSSGSAQMTPTGNAPDARPDAIDAQGGNRNA
jgi:hypothetical protein